MSLKGFENEKIVTSFNTFGSIENDSPIVCRMIIPFNFADTLCPKQLSASNQSYQETHGFFSRTPKSNISFS